MPEDTEAMLMGKVSEAALCGPCPCLLQRHLHNNFPVQCSKGSSHMQYLSTDHTVKLVPCHVNPHFQNDPVSFGHSIYLMSMTTMHTTVARRNWSKLLRNNLPCKIYPKSLAWKGLSLLLSLLATWSSHSRSGQILLC